MQSREQEFNNSESKFGLIKNKKGDVIERNKNENDLKIINLSNDATNRLLARYGLPSLDVSPGKIHIIDDKFRNKAWDYTSASTKEIFINDEEFKVILADKIVHEMIHLKSKARFRTIKNNGGGFYLQDKSSGLNNFTISKKISFLNLNEAIVEELSKKICSELFKEDIFKDDLQQRDQVIANNPCADSDMIRERIKENEAIAVKLYDPYDNNFLKRKIAKLKGKKKEIVYFDFAYYKQRKVLNLLIDKIYENKNNLDMGGKEFNFRNREEIFNVFAESMLKGDLRRVVKSIDSAFGVGTTQKLLKFENGVDKDGKPFNDVDGQLEFVKNL